MNLEIACLEELKQAEIQLMQQVYEQKLRYQIESFRSITQIQNYNYQQKKQVRRIYRQCNIVNKRVSKTKTEQSQKDLEAEKQYQKEYLKALQLEKDQEVTKLKSQYAQDIQNCYNLLRNRDY